MSQPPLEANESADDRRIRYRDVLDGIRLILADEPDWTAAMATVACELHNAFSYYHWTGFYRAVSDDTLVVGPYLQGGHGCLRISFDRGVCGAAARTRTTQFVPDVHLFPGHIACSGSTNAELVVPVLRPDGRVLAVLDIDSDIPAVFTAVDQTALEELCAWLGQKYG